MVLGLVASTFSFSINPNEKYEYRNNKLYRTITVKKTIKLGNSIKPLETSTDLYGSVTINGKSYEYKVRASIWTYKIVIDTSQNLAKGTYHFAAVAKLDAPDNDMAGIAALETKIILINYSPNQKLSIDDDSVVTSNLGDPTHAAASPSSETQHAIRDCIKAIAFGLGATTLIGEAYWLFSLWSGFIAGEYYDNVAYYYTGMPYDPSAGMRAWYHLSNDRHIPPKIVALGYDFDYLVYSTSYNLYDQFYLKLAVKFGYVVFVYGSGWAYAGIVEKSNTSYVSCEYTNVVTLPTDSSSSGGPPNYPGSPKIV